VLVVEDNPVNQKVVCHMLRKMGFTVELADDGRAGVEMLGQGAFDAVLMDCQMPVMDGYEATRAIRGLDDEVSRIPIIALTANAMDGDREKCLAAGMDDYLSKPAKADQLREVLNKWIPLRSSSTSG
jgi:CheY-like chemotaxis protein